MQKRDNLKSINLNVNKKKRAMVLIANQRRKLEK